jgi:hypothetical protein
MATLVLHRLRRRWEKAFEISFHHHSEFSLEQGHEHHLDCICEPELLASALIQTKCTHKFVSLFAAGSKY